MNRPLNQALQSLPPIPFHMPGHKRNLALLGDDLPWAADATEIAGLDHLQQPTGVLRGLAQRAAVLWGSRAAYLSVNGSTGAILAGVRALAPPGGEAIIARNCHMSVWHAAELCGLRLVVLEPEWLPAWGIYGAVAQEALDRALAEHPGAALCVITSPTYEGVVSRLRCPIPLFVDAAHGAHLPLPVCDLVTISTHKTLPALTQTALLHVMSDRVDLPRLEHQLRVFQSSSPSYVLMASVERCVALLEERREALFAAWRRRLEAVGSHAGQWRNLRLFLPDDRSKLLVQTHFDHADEALRARGIEPEYTQGRNLLFLTSPCDTDDMMRRLIEALDEIDRRPPGLPLPPFPRPPMLSASDFPLSAEYIPCPPGIPLMRAQEG
ncbi:MAG: hypothetical protein LBG83_02930 [Oscillospiraceae bacterium]|nr:hypothetical protein [Oscillospiraceae bacterium]